MISGKIVCFSSSNYSTKLKKHFSRKNLLVLSFFRAYNYTHLIFKVPALLLKKNSNTMLYPSSSGILYSKVILLYSKKGCESKLFLPATGQNSQHPMGNQHDQNGDLVVQQTQPSYEEIGRAGNKLILKKLPLYLGSKCV